jgi:cyclopropane fatty-acyl-phospholipid synthase-like methyltransferase
MKDKYYHTKDSVDEYIESAKDVNGSELIEKFKKYLAPDSLLLEIGSGPGTDFQLLKKDYKVTGSDFSEEFLKRLFGNNKNDEFLHLNATTLKTNKKFDGIYSNKVLQHLTNKELHSSIQRQAEILNTNGIICHSFWEGEGDESFKGMYVNYQTKSTLKSLFEKHFEILLLKVYQEFEVGDSLLLIGRKK